MRILLLLACTAAPSLAQSANWLLRPVTTLPASTDDALLAFDPQGSRTVAWLGRIQETWLYDGRGWQQRATAHAPPGNTGRIGCFDTVRRRFVLLIGNRSSSSMETWEWDGSDWALRATGGMLTRDGAAMAFDAARGVAVLFGGTRDGNGGLPDTWSWDGTAWRQVASGGPLPRWAHGMTFDSQRGVVVLFGGTGRPFGNEITLGDTWEWNGVYWREYFGIAGPGPRRLAAIAFDSRRQRTVLFGGVASSPLFDTWEWDGASWQAIQTSSAPMVSGAIAYDGDRGVCVLYEPTSRATWEYVSPATATVPTFTVYGQGCAGPSGIPQVAAAAGSLPRLGDAFAVELRNLPPSPLNLPFGVFGVDATSWNGQPLPVPLDPFGFTGCQAWLAPQLAVTLANAGGVATWPIEIPLDLDFAGLDFYVQGAVFAPGWNPGGIVFSDAGHAVVGTP
jgi:hypothetical protein